MKIMFGVNLRGERILRMQDRPVNLDMETGLTVPTPVGSMVLLSEMSSQFNNIKGSDAFLFAPFGKNKVANIGLGGGIYYSFGPDYRFFDCGPAITANFMDDLIQTKAVYLPHSGQFMIQGTIQLSSPKAEH